MDRAGPGTAALGSQLRGQGSCCLMQDWTASNRLEFDVIGEPGRRYFVWLRSLCVSARKVCGRSELGVTGTAYTEKGFDSMKDSFEGESSVHGACQLFRRQCFEEIGGYVPNRSGGIDWIAVTTARHEGMEDPELSPTGDFYHHRPMGTAERSSVGALFDYGKKDYFLGGSPVWQLFRVAYQNDQDPCFYWRISTTCWLLLGCSATH